MTRAKCYISDNCLDDCLYKNIGAAIAEYAKRDPTYQGDCRDEKKLEGQYRELQLAPVEKRLIEDYIACIKSRGDRYGELAYLAGMHNGIRFLRALDLIKGREPAEE